MYAVIKTGGKQYRVAPDDVIKVEKLSGAAGDKVKITDVLMVGGDGEPMIGAPMVDGATVTAELVEQARAPKIVVFKKKRRKNYRRTSGHRQDLTVLRITEIAAGGKKASAKAAEKAAPKKATDDADKKAGETKAETAAEVKTAKAAAAPEKKPAKAEKKTKPAAPEALFTAPEGEPDDLKKISGVGPAIEKKLNALGITKYEQIAKFKKADIEQVDEVLNFKGRIERDGWLDQAKELAKEAKK